MATFSLSTTRTDLSKASDLTSTFSSFFKGSKPHLFPNSVSFSKSNTEITIFGDGFQQKCAPRCSVSFRETESETNMITPRTVARTKVRLALPSKGRMAEQTIELLQNCQLTLYKPNPRQYIATISEMKMLEVWFQRASDVVRKIKAGDIDLGIVGYDMVKEFGKDDDDFFVAHEALGYGNCHLAVAVPNYGIFENIESMDDLLSMKQWSETNPLRIVTGYTHLGKKFLSESGMKHFTILTADGALEAAPAMGTADAILDLVSSGTTLKENNLKELKGGKVLESQAVLVANKKSLLEREEVVNAVHELIDRFESHLRAKNQFIITANIDAKSEESVADKMFTKTSFPGLEGPTISHVYSQIGSAENAEFSHFSVSVVVPKSRLYEAITQIRNIGGRGVLVSPVTYIFDEEPLRWQKLSTFLEESKSK